MSHTPGPWFVSERRSICAKWLGEDEVQLASMSTTHWTQSDDGKNAKMAEALDANARLIAAAPELLAAATLGLHLSNWAAAINWNRRRNTREWMDGLRERIEYLQAFVGPLLDRIDGKPTIQKARGAE